MRLMSRLVICYIERLVGQSLAPELFFLVYKATNIAVLLLSGLTHVMLRLCNGCFSFKLRKMLHSHQVRLCHQNPQRCAEVLWLNEVTSPFVALTFVLRWLEVVPAAV